MATSDSLIIDSLTLDNYGDKLTFPNNVLLDKQIKKFTPTITSGTYGTTIEFQYKDIDTETQSLNSNVLELIMAVKSTTDTAYDNNTKLAIPGSVLSLIRGVDVYANGTQQLSEKNIQQMNNLRILLDYSGDFQKTKGAGLGFFKDDQNQLIAQTVTAVPIYNNADPPVATTYNLATPSYSDVLDSNAANRGFTKRVNYLNLMKLGVENGVIYYRLYIPLKYISNFFKYAVKPIRYSRLSIIFTLDSGIPSFIPIQHESGVDNASVSFVASYGAGTTQMHYDKIAFGVDANSQYASLLKSSLTTNFKFLYKTVEWQFKILLVLILILL